MDPKVGEYWTVVYSSITYRGTEYSIWMSRIEGFLEDNKYLVSTVCTNGVREAYHVERKNILNKWKPNWLQRIFGYI